jgi:multidrug resistance efflux pump
MSKKMILGAVGAILVLVLASIVAFYWYEGEHFVSTEDARISANLVTISPEINGKIVEWNVREGDMVQAGDLLGRQDLGGLLNSGSINTATMATIGSIAAEKASIKAPIAGQVIRSSAVIGQMAVPGTNLAVVADTEQLYIGANIQEAQIGRVRVGQAVELSVDAFPGVAFQGRVETIGRATASTFSLLPTQNSGGNYTKVSQIVPIKIHLLDNQNKPLLVGMNTSIRILLDTTPVTKDTQK